MKQSTIASLFLILQQHALLASSSSSSSSSDDNNHNQRHQSRRANGYPKNHPIHARKRASRTQQSILEQKNNRGNDTRKRRLRGHHRRPAAPQSQQQPQSVQLQQQQQSHNHEQQPQHYSHNQQHQQQQSHNKSNHPQRHRRRRRLNEVSQSYLASNPWYPSHDLLQCLADGNPPSWMTWSGGYAEAHLFRTNVKCCERWFPEVDGCFDDAAGAADTNDDNGVANDNGGDGVVNTNEGGAMEEMTNWADTALDAAGGDKSAATVSTTQSTAATTTNYYNNNRPSSHNERPLLEGGNKGGSVNSLSNSYHRPEERPQQSQSQGGGDKGGSVVSNAFQYDETRPKPASSPTETTAAAAAVVGGTATETTVGGTVTTTTSAAASFGGDKADGSVDSLSAGASNFDQLTIVEQSTSTLDNTNTNWQSFEEVEDTSSRGHGVPVNDDDNSQNNQNTQPSSYGSPNVAGHGAEQTFPTSSCGTGWSTAQQCTHLCLSNSGACPPGMNCHPNIPCPASQVAAAMGNAGSSILGLIGGTDGNGVDAMGTNVCGLDYADAESKCRAGEADEGGGGDEDEEWALGFSDDFQACSEALTCPPTPEGEDRHCYGGILCPLPPTVSPAPTRAPIPQYSINHGANAVFDSNGVPMPSGGHGKSIVAYYAAWQYYNRQKISQPTNLNYNMFTRINYAFFQTNKDGYIWGTDDWADSRILFGDVRDVATPGAICMESGDGDTIQNGEGCYCHSVGVDGVKECHFHNVDTGLIHLAHSNGVEVYPSIGGWTLSDDYPEMASGRLSREKFAESCVGLILEYGFDGIDIDWEYPGYVPHSGTSADTENFILLLRTVRSALDALGSQTGKYYGLTAALPCGPSNIANQDIQQVAEILDELNLMTYDFHGSWDSITGHNAPLFDQPQGDHESGWSVHGCVENWVGSTSSPDYPNKEAHRAKVNIGLPFYGRSYLDTTELYMPHGGNDEYSWYDDGGVPQYFHIKTKLDEGELRSVRDETTKTPYAYFTNGYGMVSYDDPRSVCDKAEYVVDEGLGGFIIWEISGDMMDDFHQPLLEALNRKLALPDTNCKADFGVPEVYPTQVEPGNDDPVVSGTVDDMILMEQDEKLPSSETSIPMDEEPIIRGDKSEVVGIPAMPPPPPAPKPVPVSVPLPLSNASPYTIDKSTFGPLSVASEACDGGCPPNSSCVGNSAAGQLIADAECNPCAGSQTWWPCDVPGLCWCWADGTNRIAPAPMSGVDEYQPKQAVDEYYTVCDDILSRGMFMSIAPEARDPYTYEGLCDAIISYNAHHKEEIFGMGTDFQRAAELAAFLGNTLHESDEFRAGREYLMCADNVVMPDGEVYCKPCDPGSFDWTTMKCGHSLVSGKSDFNEYCQPSSKPPEACDCGNGQGASDRGVLEGYVAARHLFFGRGAIQLSWNYNYIGASVALTGSPDTFCDNPDVVATEGKYAWGAGIYFWMEHVKEGTTSHMEALKEGGDFGGTLNNINGGLECPAHGGWHVDAVKMRLNRYCRAAKKLGLPNLMRLDNCAGLQESLDVCLTDGLCDECRHFVGTNFGDLPSKFELPPQPAPMTVTSTVEQAQPEEPLCPDGLMPWDENEECCVPNSAFIGDGACDPEAPYNTAECNYDNGDCCKDTCNTDSSAFGCTTKEGSPFGYYGPFGFYCIDPSQGGDVINSLLCNVEERERIGDGMCNPMYNTAECNYDGGDCCETCDETFGFYSCGSGVQGYQCLDPLYIIADATNLPTLNPPTPSPTTRVPRPGATPNPTTEARPGATPNPTVRSRPGATTTKYPTHPPTKFPTRTPTWRPVEDYSPPDSLLNQDGVLSMICPMDMMECPTGKYVSRDPLNNCLYDPCPEPPQEQSVAVVGCESTLKECPGSGTFVEQDPDNNCNYFPCPHIVESVAVVACEETLKECQGSGTFVKQDPNNNCNFFPCPKIVVQEVPEEVPEEPQEQLTPSPLSNGSKNSLASAISSAMHGKNSYMQDTDEQETCNNDMIECSIEGVFVKRNPSNHCKFFACPKKEEEEEEPPVSSLAASISSKEEEEEPPISLAASINSSFGQNHRQCNDEVVRCIDGSFMGRDPDNGCEFFECTTSNNNEPMMAASISASLGQNAPSSHVCTDDRMECRDGSFVARDPDNGCTWFACPTAASSKPQPMAASISSSLGQDVHRCSDEVARCPDGSFVVRDPDNACEYFACSAGSPPTEQPTSHPTGRAAVMTSMAGSVHNKYNAQVDCTNELFDCGDGHYVTQDPDDNCNWYPCEHSPTKRPTQKPTNYQLSTLSECATDLYVCPDGSFMGRDKDNGCTFFSCPPDGGSEEEGGMMKMSQQVKLTHQKTKQSGVIAGDYTRHKKKNNGRSR